MMMLVMVAMMMMIMMMMVMMMIIIVIIIISITIIIIIIIIIVIIIMLKGSAGFPTPVLYVVSDGDCIRGSGGYINHLTTRPTHIRHLYEWASANAPPPTRAASSCQPRDRSIQRLSRSGGVPSLRPVMDAHSAPASAVHERAWHLWLGMGPARRPFFTILQAWKHPLDRHHCRRRALTSIS